MNPYQNIRAATLEEKEAAGIKENFSHYELSAIKIEGQSISYDPPGSPAYKRSLIQKISIWLMSFRIVKAPIIAASVFISILKGEHG